MNSGDTVRVHYTGELDDGTVVATSKERGPFQFVVGRGTVIPGFEEVVISMEPGESKTARIPAEKAFGPYREELLQVVDRHQFPDDLEPTVGQKVSMTDGNRRTTTVVVAEVSGSKITLDTNHLLAGEDMTFDIELVEIV